MAHDLPPRDMIERLRSPTGAARPPADAFAAASTGNLRAFIDQAPFSIAMFDRDMRYLAASQRWLDDLCDSRCDVIGRSHYDVNPEIPEAWKALHRRALAGERLGSARDRRQYPDGSPKWVRWEVAPWREADGTIGGVTIMGEDVTAVVDADQALRQGTKALARLHDAGWRLRLAGSLREGLNELLVATIELLGASMGLVHLLDGAGKVLRLATQYGFAPEVPEALREIPTADDRLSAQTLRARMPFVVEDVETDDVFAPYRSLARAAGFRAVVISPLIGRYGALLGVISTHFPSPHRPADIDMQRLELYRRRAADFIERFRSEEALRESNARLEAETRAMARFHQSGARLWRAQSLDEGLAETLDGAIDLLGADMGNVQLLDRDGKALRVAAQRGFKQDFLDFFREVSAADETSCARALRAGHVEVIEDVECDASFAAFEAIRRSAGYRAVVSAPLIHSSGQLLGMLSVHFRAPRRPSASELLWLELYGRRAADFVGRFRSRQALRESEERLRLALDTGHMAMFDRDLRTGAHVWNDELYRLYGYEVGEFEPSRDAWTSRLHPDDRQQVVGSMRKAEREREAYSHEFRIVRPDGAVRWVRCHGRFFYENGEQVRTIGLLEDITAARQLAETQRVLVAELQHRTRNLMGVVQSIAHQTLSTSGSLDEFESRFDRRLTALSRVQGLLSSADDAPITLGALIHMELEALGPAKGRHEITVRGPELPLRKSAVEILALAIHELATNAVKYGALAGETGRLSVTWRMECMEKARRLVLSWFEHGTAPRTAAGDMGSGGYGRTLIEQALPYSLGADTRFELGLDGLLCVISIPQSAIAAPEAAGT